MPILLTLFHTANLKDFYAGLLFASNRGEDKDYPSLDIEVRQGMEIVAPQQVVLRN